MLGPQEQGSAFGRLDSCVTSENAIQSGFGCRVCFNCSGQSFQRTFAKIEKERQGQTHSHCAQPDNRKPSELDAEQPSFDAHKHHEDCGRDKDIQPEEQADPVGEELTDEEIKLQPTFHDPRDELGIGMAAPRTQRIK